MVQVLSAATSVLQWLQEESTPVVVLDKLTYAGSLDNLAEATENPHLTFVQGDIGDDSLVDSLLIKYQPTAIVNFAAESHVDRSIDSPEVFVQTNVVGTNRLLESCMQYWQSLESDEQNQFRFLHISTDEVYGSLGKVGKFTESSPYQPNSPYAASKAAADHLVRAYHQTFNLPTIITCSCNNYGPRQLPEKLIPLMLFNALEGRSLPLYGDGKNVRDWIYVEEHCQALRLILSQGKVGEVYNIGSNCELTNLKLVTTICDTLDQLIEGFAYAPSKSLIKFVEDRPGHDRRYAVDTSKLATQLGWSSSTDFRSNLTETIRWFLEHEVWVQSRMKDSQLRQRLGLRQS